MASERSNEIVNNFYSYIKKTGDRKLIESYSIEELKRAKYEYSEDSKREFYIAIEDRIKELEDTKTQKRTAKEKWLDRLFGFITGIFVALLGICLRGCIK